MWLWNLLSGSTGSTSSTNNTNADPDQHLYHRYDLIDWSKYPTPDEIWIEHALLTLPDCEADQQQVLADIRANGGEQWQRYAGYELDRAARQQAIDDLRAAGKIERVSGNPNDEAYWRWRLCDAE